MPIRKYALKWHLNGAVIVKREERNLLIQLCTEPIFTKLLNAEKVFVNISCAKFCSNQMKNVENAGQNFIFTLM